jgi:hypothetical protein
MNRKKIYSFGEFVLNEVKIQNAQEAIGLITSKSDKKEKSDLVKEITREYFSQELIDGLKVLNINDRSQDISVLQSILIGLGYLKNHNADGLLDQATIDAAKTISKDFNLPIQIENQIPLSFIKFLLEFESKEGEEESTKGVLKEPKIPSVVTPTADLKIQPPTPSITKGEGVNRGVDYPSSEFEQYISKSIQYSKIKDGEKNLSPNFKVSEFACKDGSDVILINPHLIELLEKIREHFGKDININSGYRTPSYNAGLSKKSKKVAKKSQHMFGNAADITISGVTPKEIYNYVDSFHQGGLGLYSNFVHVDVRDTIGSGRSRW